jgi:hypothetical protein
MDEVHPKSYRAYEASLWTGEALNCRRLWSWLSMINSVPRSWQKYACRRWMELEKRAHEKSKEVYSRTSPWESKGLQMRLSIKSKTRDVLAATGALVLALLAACATWQSSAPVVSTVVAETSGGLPPEVIVYASDLPSETLVELDFINDSASPNGKLIGLPNSGDELDPPPENDPHVTFKVHVQSGVPYRCWIHMKVGTAKGRSTANVVWVQFSDSVDRASQAVFRPGTNSYLTAQGSEQQGWKWVRCEATGSETLEALVYFQTTTGGEVTVRLQAGAEGVGFDQFILSPAKFLNAPPSEPIVEK